MYGWSGFGILRRDLPVSNVEPFGGRYPVDGIVRLGGPADQAFERAALIIDSDPIAASTGTPSETPVPTPVVVNPAGKTVINSSGPVSVPVIGVPATDAGFFSSIPWWAWLAGAGVGVYALKKGAR